MKLAISIPTYRPHLRHNFAFLESLVRYHARQPIPEIFFTTGDVGERDELAHFVSTLPEAVSRRVHVLSLHEKLAAVSDPALARDLDGGFAYGAIGFITYKKFLGLEHAFARGFDWVVVIDSEVLQFREADLDRTLRDEIARNEYRTSVAAYREPWATKVQHDSLRTVAKSYDTQDAFAKSYGWFDNLCAFEKTSFDRFLDFLAGDSGETGPRRTLRATAKFRGFAFDWIVYKAWERLIDGRVPKLVDLDAKLGQAGVKLRPKPQTENVFLYFTGDVEHDAAVVRALDPPWVPFTRNADYIEALKRGTAETCCLMFHADRNHPGAAALPNFRQRLTRRLVPIVKRLAKRILAVED